ncbi:MAG: DUF2953 domain-containing protein [Dehalococcoidia bacterium]|nr:DUF2953 domain-containing protein [Dehalococcoidia bacterium]
MWAIAALASLAVLITLLLCVPLDLVFRTNIDGKPRFGMRLIWLFGLVSHEVRRRKKKPEEERAIEHKQKPKDWIWRIRVTFEVLRTKGLLRQFVSLVKRIRRHIKIKELVANFNVGLDNPADTGLLFAFIAPANLLLSYFSPHQIRIEPSFTGEATLEGHLYGAVRVRPIQLAAPLMGFAFSSPTLRAVKKLVLSKWKRKE